MVKTLYDYAYTNPAGYKYTGQVVADTAEAKYNYATGQTYAAPQGGSYAITGTGTPTTAPSGAVYQKTYTTPTGQTYDSWKYDVKDNAYYNINTGYDTNTGLYTPPAVPGVPPKTPVPAWGGIGLGEEYGYVNVGTPAAPDYQSYGGGGWAQVNPTPGVLSAYNYKFTYPDGAYYLGKVVDDGTYGYDVGKSYTKGVGKYDIYAKDATPPAPDAQAGWTYVSLYHDASGTNYPPTDIVPTSPWYNKATGYGGVGSEKSYVQKPGGYYQFDETAPATGTAIASVPLPT